MTNLELIKSDTETFWKYWLGLKVPKPNAVYIMPDNIKFKRKGKGKSRKAM